MISDEFIKSQLRYQLEKSYYDTIITEREKEVVGYLKINRLLRVQVVVLLIVAFTMFVFKTL